MGVMVPGVMGTNVVGKASRVDGIAIFLRGMKVERMFQALISRHARWSSDTPLEVRKGLGVFS